MDGKVIKAMFIFAPIFSVFLLNLYAAQRSGTIVNHDKKYIVEHCEAITTAPEEEVDLVADPSIDGTLYIYNTRPEISAVQIEAAFRPIWSEALCLTMIGCALPPTLSPACGDI